MDFKNNATTIIKSSTGTGKSQTIAECTHQYLKESSKRKYKILTITSRISLSNQHLESFNKCNMVSYYDGNKKKCKEEKELMKASALTLCVTSLSLLSELTIQEISNYIIYIDVINSFLTYLTHCDTLNNGLRETHIYIYIVKEACKQLS